LAQASKSFEATKRLKWQKKLKTEQEIEDKFRITSTEADVVYDEKENITGFGKARKTKKK